MLTKSSPCWGAAGWATSIARDTKLHRDVALKILPEILAADADRLARFRREAHVLASLSHPNIAAIYGLEEGPTSGGIVHALVLELVEGPTLAERIAASPVPLEEALSIARQITDALGAAHEQGIVHRDLKPANIKVRPDGTVKVLDFGLARTPDPDPAEMSHAATVTSPAVTVAGVILGTAAYMAPEQATGRAADARSDIWAFGLLLYEMLSGRRGFAGETTVEVLSNVLKAEPDWKALPADTPALVRSLLSAEGSRARSSRHRGRTVPDRRGAHWAAGIWRCQRAGPGAQGARATAMGCHTRRGRGGSGRHCLVHQAGRGI